MGDSEDDERRGGRFDKFARERDGAERRRDDDRRGGYRNDYSNGGVKRSAPGRRDDFSVDAKRSRQASEAEDGGVAAASAAAVAVPVLLPFKKWLLQQDDSITDEDAVSKYNEYKMEHKRQLLLKFFAAHKEEEWFRQKYHPEESAKRKDEHKENVTKRNEIFKELHGKGFFDGVSLDLQNAKKIIFIMDAVAVKMEGGTDEDVELLRQQKVVDESLLEIGEKDDEKAENENGGSEAKEGEENGESKPKKMQLHKTQALFLRNVEANIKSSEVEEVCKRYPGFLRICLSEPVPDKKFARRGWATYKRDVNIKQIALNINSIRIRETDLHAIINKDLTKKIRTVNGVAAHKSVAQADLALAAKLAAIYDLRSGLYTEVSEEEREADIRLGVDLVEGSPNPIIKSVRPFIVEEMSPEEEELLRMGGGVPPSSGQTEGDKFILQRDDDILAALDLIVFYLRIVHSVDFYTHGEYSNEDSMPNRCGIMHVRSPPPSGSQFESDEEGRPLLTAKFVGDFKAANQTGVEKMYVRSYISEDDIAKLGRKNPEDEVEAFVLANTVELSAEKWLCPLSGKKFKGPEFIRKHLTTKHQERLDEAKQDAVFYNSFLADPARPTEPEAPAAPAREERSLDDRGDRNMGRNDYGNRGYGGDRNRYSGGGPPRHGGYGGGRDDQRRMPQRSAGGRYYDGAPPPPPQGAETRRDSRAPISYRDLDAPDEIF